MYLLEVGEDNKHSCYYTAMAETHLIDSYIFAPEQLRSI